MVTSQEPYGRPKLGVWEWAGPLVAAAVVAAYGLSLRRYGLELADEGVLLAHFNRVAHGQVPYRDFHVGYGPGLYWLQAAAFALWGGSIGTVRVGLALVQGARAAGLAWLAASLGGRGAAAVAVLALVAFFLPVAPGQCVPANIPYPAWYADALGLGALVLMVRSPRSSALVGSLWGVVFAFKQNTGVLGLAAAIVTTILVAPRAERAGRGVPVLTALAIIVGALALLREHLHPTLAAVFVGPLIPLAFAVARARVGRSTIRDLMAIAGGFLVVAGSAVAVMVLRAGAAAVASGFLQIGTDTIRIYHAAYPTLDGVLASLREVTPMRAVRLLVEGGWFVVFPVTHLVAATLVCTGRIRTRCGVAVVVAAAVGYLQLYPRMDYWHLLPLAPASLATLVLLGASVGGGWTTVALGVTAVVCVARMAPTVPIVLASLTAPHPAPRIPRLDLAWDLLTDERLVRIPDVVEAVRDRRRVAGFPALGIVNFALDSPSPWRHDYFFPGRPDALEEEALAAALARDPPEAVIVLDETSGPFGIAFTAHRRVLTAIESGLVEQRRIGPYRILVPRTP